MFSVATVFLLLASLVAAAGFAVVAQRRLRQLGMLAAIGATEKHRRLVLLTNGAVVGALAALVGTIAGLALWVVFAPTLESAVDHRIDRLSLPWALIAMAVVLAVVGATAAAWWPGRTVARLPVLLALSGRPPKPRPARHSAIAAAALIAVGVGCLALSDRDSPPLIIAGIVATILGTLLLGPLAIRIFARPPGTSRSPRAWRCATSPAIRPVPARHSPRSPSPSASRRRSSSPRPPRRNGDDEPPPGRRTCPTARSASTRARRNARSSSRSRSTPAQLARSARRPPTRRRSRSRNRDPASEGPPTGEPPIVDDGSRALVTVGLAREVDPRWTLGSGLFVATPALLRHLGIDPATIDPSTDFLADPTVPTNELVILDIRPEDIRRHERPADRQPGSPRLRRRTAACRPRSSPSTVFAATAGRRSQRLARRVEPASHQRTDRSRPRARRRRRPRDRDAAKEHLLRTPIAIATAAGALLALAILAMTVGLIRSESAGDLRTLTAAGATAGSAAR